MTVDAHQLECLVCSYLSDLGHQVELKAETPGVFGPVKTRSLEDLRGMKPQRISIHGVARTGLPDAVLFQDRHIRVFCSFK